MFYFLLKRYHKKYRHWELTRYKELKCILLELKIYMVVICVLACIDIDIFRVSDMLR